MAGLIPRIQEPNAAASDTRRKLSKEISISAEDMTKLDTNHLVVSQFGESYRAYSDSQLFPAPQEATECLERDDERPTSPSTSGLRSQHRAKLSAAKLHIKNLFGQSPHSSNSNLADIEDKDSAADRRSRLHFMHQWSQVGHNKRSKFTREELEKWGESLTSLLASHSGVLVFSAFLRSEFSEENLQFYLACEQYRHSSNKFSLQRRAKNICATYIHPGAPREVNLDSKTRDLTLELLQAPSHTSLLPAQKRIYFLLDTDCYPRFLQSSIYQQLLEEAK